MYFKQHCINDVVNDVPEHILKNKGIMNMYVSERASTKSQMQRYKTEAM